MKIKITPQLLARIAELEKSVEWWQGCTKDCGDVINDGIESRQQLRAKVAELERGSPRCECCGYLVHQSEHLGCIRAADKTAAPEPVAVPTGWKLVPVEPTREMLEKTSWPGCAATDYKHMLAAAPEPATVAVDAGALIEQLRAAAIASQARIAELEQANNRVILGGSTVPVSREALELLAENIEDQDLVSAAAIVRRLLGGGQ